MPSNDSLTAFHIVIKDLKSAPATPGLASLLRHWGILVRLLRSLSELQCPHLGTGAVSTSLMRSCSSRVLLNKLPPCHSALLLLLSLRSRREFKELRTLASWRHTGTVTLQEWKKSFLCSPQLPGDHSENLQKPRVS